ncbi:hypothetical protein U472_09740 [Orenia metallireducens]|uniref:Uncharacterized protein n=1 Tax=Orenia metallireducens TaxID=1413210 RepID=A0A1C0A7Q0_9FIRM|nr:hypothetical protein [Orenia metallireducens]OCL26283.1 hypothetical protein U472_09740 [Orenia metallireducens]
MKEYNAKPIDQTVLNELRSAIEDFEKLVGKQLRFSEIREKHQNLMDKFSTVVELRNKNINEAVPDEDIKIFFEKASLFGKSNFKVNIDPDVENLLDKALELSNKYIKMITDR